MHSGVGERRARSAARALLDGGAGRLLVWGCAGALIPGLRPGTLILPTEVRDENGGRYALDPEWREALQAGIPAAVEASVLVTAAVPVATAAGKQTLARRTGATAVDMEAAAVAAVAAERGVACMVLRAIADPLELDLPGVVLAARGDRLLALEIPLRLLGQPRDVPAMRALARHFGAARRTLEEVARCLAGFPASGNSVQ